MNDILHTEAGYRFRRAIAGDPGVLCTGVTFLAADTIASFTSDSGPGETSVSAICRLLRPDFAFTCSWDSDAKSICAEFAARGTVPLWVVRGPLDAVAAAHGWQHALTRTAADPQALSKEMDRFVSQARVLVEQASAYGAGGVVVAEDVATTTGSLLDPGYVARELIPRLGAIARMIAGAGLLPVWHSDGDVRALIPLVAAEGFSATHPGGLDEKAFEQLFYEARRAGMAVLGGITGDALRGGGDAAAIEAGVSSSLLARKGGLLVCDDGGVASGEELSALASALEAAREAWRDCAHPAD